MKHFEGGNNFKVSISISRCEGNAENCNALGRGEKVDVRGGGGGF